MQIKPNLPSFSSRDIPTGHTPQAIMGERDESHAGKVLFERRKKQMHDMQTAVTKLQEMKKNASPKKMASQRAALLKQRLDTLKSIMAKLPPGNYKALAQELKQIAKELAALGKQMGNSGGSLGNMPAMSAALGEAMADSASEETVGIDANAYMASSMPDIDVTVELNTAVEVQTTAEQAAQVEARQAESLSAEIERDLNAKDNEQHDAKVNKPRIAGLRQNEDADDKALRAILTEASKTLKEVLNLLKAKHQVDDKESRKLFARIESELDTLDQSLQQSALTASESEPVASGNIEAGNSANMGGFVDISV